MNKYKVNYLQPILDGKYCSLFYGGRMAEIVLSEHIKLLISASGDVDATLFDDNGNVVEEVRDKNNTGAFSREMTHVNEKNIYDLMEDGKLQVRDNNWWEVNGLLDDVFVEFPLLDNVLDSFRIDDAVVEVLLNDYINWCLEVFKDELCDDNVSYYYKRYVNQWKLNHDESEQLLNYDTWYTDKWQKAIEEINKLLNKED